MKLPKRPIVLVTGTSSGIGREAVEHLKRADCVVIATARRLADIKALAERGRVECLALDVTDEKSRQKAVDTILERHGRIDALVNNAGYGAYVPMEETDLDALQAMFDVNVFGLHRLTQIVLPHMRKQGHGRIVNVSSVAGHLSIPMMGAYCASKFALRALTTALHAEVRQFGIHACLIEPGRIRTQFGTRARSETDIHDTKRPPDQGPYAAMKDRWNRVDINSRGGHPRVIARRIRHACTAKRPRFHYFAPWDAKGGNILKRLLPDAAINLLLRLYLRPRRSP